MTLPLAIGGRAIGAFLAKKGLVKGAKGLVSGLARKLGRKGRKAVVKIAQGTAAIGGTIGGGEVISRIARGRGAGAAIEGLDSRAAMQLTNAERKALGMNRKPRMNSANPRALRRAIRRVVGFKKLARAVGFSKVPAKMKGVRNPKGR